MKKTLLFLASGFLFSTVSQAAASSPACFDLASNAKLAATNSSGFQLLEISPPAWANRASMPASSNVYPATAYVSGNIAGLQTPQPSGGATAIGQMYSLWVNRCAPMTTFNADGSVDSSRTTRAKTLNPMMGCPGKARNAIGKGNHYLNMIPTTDANGKMLCDSGGQPEILRPLFSTLQKANICTRLQALRTIRNTPQASLVAKASRFGLDTYFASTANPLIPATSMQCGQALPEADQALAAKASQAQVNGAETAVTGSYLVDVCIFEPMAEPRSAMSGLALDYEVQDGRPTEAIISLFQSLKSILNFNPALKLFVFTDDLSTGGVPNGFTAGNFLEILNSVDYLVPILWTGAVPSGPSGSDLAPHGYTFSLTADFVNQRTKIIEGAQSLTSAEWSKILLAATLYYDDCSLSGNHCAGQLSDLSAVREQFLALGGGGFMISKAGVPQIGAQSCSATAQVPSINGQTTFPMQVNQVIACMAYGACDGSYTN